MLRRNEHLRLRESKSPRERATRAKQRRKEIELQRADAPMALKEYYDAQQAEREKTERLRALRLARVDE